MLNLLKKLKKFDSCIRNNTTKINYASSQNLNSSKNIIKSKSWNEKHYSYIVDCSLYIGTSCYDWSFVSDFVVSKVETYTLSIPKLGIKDSITTIGGEDLSKSLVHYPGTALPGRIGNAVVFGHSALPIFFSPTNYKTIFATLPTLKIGDEIIVNYDGVKYRYIIEQLFDVLPTDIQILEQDDSDSFISLVTCIPPGDPRNPRRLIVRARIVT